MQADTETNTQSENVGSFVQVEYLTACYERQTAGVQLVNIAQCVMSEWANVNKKQTRELTGSEVQALYVRNITSCYFGGSYISKTNGYDCKQLL